MVSTHTSSRGMTWELGGEDIYITITNTNTNNNDYRNIDYVIVDLSHQEQNKVTYLTNLPLFIKLIKFLKHILYI